MLSKILKFEKAWGKNYLCLSGQLKNIEWGSGLFCDAVSLFSPFCSSQIYKSWKLTVSVTSQQGFHFNRPLIKGGMFSLALKEEHQYNLHTMFIWALFFNET